jgi:5-methylcytosine-specific restriction protein A
VTPANEVDHVDGDSHNNAPSNLQSLCKPCHSAKTVNENGGFGNEMR